MDSGESLEVVGNGEEGDGIVAPAGRGGAGPIAYVGGALPGDQVCRLADGSIALTPRASEARRAVALCPHAADCGGCQVQHMSDAYYAGWKAQKLRHALERLKLASDGDGVSGTCISVALATRRRAVFSAGKTGTGTQLGFHAHRSHDLVDIADCAVLRASIVAALPHLRAIAALICRRDTTCRVAVLDCANGLDVAIIETGTKAGHPVRVSGELAQIAGEGRIVRLTIEGEPVVLRAKPVITVGGVDVVPPPGAFVQATAEAEAAMAALASEAVVAAKARRVADLFCGLGAFTLGVARHARVEGFDSDASLVGALGEAARHASGLKPIVATTRDLYRDPLSPNELARFDAIVFDPPRAGAKAQAESLARSNVRTVVAVSCNPVTLARDLRILVDGGYRLEKAVGIDQFLYSTHLEAVAVLSRPAQPRNARRR